LEALYPRELVAQLNRRARAHRLNHRAAFNMPFNKPSSPPSGTSPASICSKI
jgi:hypothetical protein